MNPNTPQDQNPNPVAPQPQAAPPIPPVQPAIQQQPVMQAAPMQPQPGFAPTQQPGIAPVQAVPKSDPGKIFGIISIALFFFSWIATIIGIIGLVLSRRAGHKGTLSIIGIVVSLVFLVVAGWYMWNYTDEFDDLKQELHSNVERPINQDKPAGNVVNVDSDSELGQKMNDLDNSEKTAGAKSNAGQVMQRATAYNTKTGDYPKSIDDFAKFSETAIPEAAKKHIASAIPTASSDTKAYYQYCTKGAAQVLYFDYTKQSVASLGLGSLQDNSPSCK